MPVYRQSRLLQEIYFSMRTAKRFSAGIYVERMYLYIHYQSRRNKLSFWETGTFYYVANCNLTWIRVTIALGIRRVAIINFRKVGQKGLKNEDKIGQKSDYFIKCYQSLTSYIFIFEPWCILINNLLSWKIIFEFWRLANWRRNR